LDAYWALTSSFGTPKALWCKYAALYKHFTPASGQCARDSKERANFLGLHQRFSPVLFVKSKEIMYDAQQELSEISLQLPHRNIFPAEAHRSICLQIRLFEGMANKSGKYAIQTSKAASKMTLYEVPFYDGHKGAVNKLVSLPKT
jgi:hypothetical protein